MLEDYAFEENNKKAPDGNQAHTKIIKTIISQKCLPA
nr:MAG TPA: hypothetical protein [Caudoviricetes sp.]DAX82822.1 MAG TPA: hypothetical protein [Caudoviricetes sp.]